MTQGGPIPSLRRELFYEEPLLRHTSWRAGGPARVFYRPAAGLKGIREGGAQISDKRASFIVNTGDATAADIERLIQPVQAEVEGASGVMLVSEVKRI